MSLGAEMERHMSVDDLVGGIWRLNQAHANGGSTSSFPRTDSEAAFQEFLKRIPSASNLSNLDSAQLQQQLARGGPSAGSLLLGAPSGSVPAPPNIDLLGIPRVPSLDYLRQLASQQQQQHVKLENGAGAAPIMPGLPSALMLADLASMNAATSAAALTASALTASALQAVPNLNSTAAAAALLSHHQMAAAAAAAHPHPSPVHVIAPGPAQREQAKREAGQQARAPQGRAPAPASNNNRNKGRNRAPSPASEGGTMSGSEPDSGNEREGGDKSENRRARRMLSNRESARRSRRRKQEHLGKLEQEISILQDERRDLQDQVAQLQDQVASAFDESQRLRADNQMLREQILGLGAEPKERPAPSPSHKRPRQDSDRR